MGSQTPESETTARLRPVLVSLAALLAAACISAAAPGPAAADATPRDEFYGLSAPELYSMSLDGRHELRDRALGQIERLGVDMVRTEIGWRDVEPHPPLLGLHDYRWQSADDHVVALAEHSQRLMPMLMAPPGWAQAAESANGCQRRGMVARGHIDDFAAYAAEVARRFGRDGQLWRWAEYWRPELPQRPITTYEIWNEPNWDAFSCPRINPEVYAEAVAAAADAIHAVDPRAQVTVGGLVVLERDQWREERLLGMATERFLRRMVAQVPTLGDRIDAVAVHTYWATPQDNLRAIGLVERWLRQAGLGGEPLVVSEFGWHVEGDAEAVSEADRARMVGAYARALAALDCGVDAVFPHNWITPRVNARDAEDWFGLADPDTGAPLPSGEAYGNAIADSPDPGVRAACDPPGAGPAPAPPAPTPAAPAEPPPGDAGAEGGPAGADALEGVRAPSRTRSRRPTVRFRVAVGARVEAKLDRRPRREVSSPWRLPRLRPGRHVVRLRVRDRGRVVAKRTLRIRVLARSG